MVFLITKLIQVESAAGWHLMRRHIDDVNKDDNSLELPSMRRDRGS